MALSDVDRQLLDRCLNGKPRAWEDFVDRFMGLVVHAVTHSASCRSLRLSATDREDLVAEVFLAILNRDMAVLRRFSGRSSLATYLSVIARRVVVHKLMRDSGAATSPLPTSAAAPTNGAEQRLADRDEVESMLRRLEGAEAIAMRMYHLEGRTYQEIAAYLGMPEGSVGPLLSRARARLR